jgi:hypothetical protein
VFKLSTGVGGKAALTQQVERGLSYVVLSVDDIVEHIQLGRTRHLHDEVYKLQVSCQARVMQ